MKNCKTTVLVLKKFIFLVLVVLTVIFPLKLSAADSSNLSLLYEADDLPVSISPHSMTQGIGYERVLSLAKTSIGDRNINCFISRAWEEDLRHQHNRFVLRLNNDLLRAGVKTYLDVKDLSTGSSIPEYISNIERPDFFVVLVVTPHLLEQYKQNSWIKKEIDIIKKRLNNENFFYIPVYIGLSDEQRLAVTDLIQPANQTKKTTKEEYLYKDFSVEKNYQDNVIDILIEKILVDPKQKNKPAFVNPTSKNFKVDPIVYQSFQDYWKDKFVKNHPILEHTKSFCIAIGSAIITIFVMRFYDQIN